MRPAHVVGAGLSGLATAWHLAERGFAVTVFEKASRPGGLIHTVATEDGPVETAANAFVWTETVSVWFERLRLAPVFARPESAKRYIFRDGRPRRWPLSVTESLAMGYRLAATGATRAFSATAGESAAAWGDRVMGRAGRQWLLDAALQGVYATPSSSLSAQAIFGQRRSGRRRMVTAPEGMGQFIARLHERLAARGVTFKFDSSVDALTPLVPTAICTSVGDASRLVEPHAPAVAERIAAVQISALATVTMFFERARSDTHGFGVLFPEPSGIHALGVLFNADIFDGRGTRRSETWIVGDRVGAVTKWSDVALREAILADRERLAHRTDAPLSVRITRWPQAIPVYDHRVLDVMAATSLLPSWIALAGNYLGRIGVAHLLEEGERAALRLDGSRAI